MGEPLQASSDHAVDEPLVHRSVLGMTARGPCLGRFLSAGRYPVTSCGALASPAAVEYRPEQHVAKLGGRLEALRGVGFGTTIGTTT